MTESVADCLGARNRRIGQIDLRVPVDEQVQSPVAVVVAESRACGPAAHRHPGLLAHVGEGSVVVVVIQAVLAVVGHVEVGPAIVVVSPTAQPYPHRSLATPAFSRDVGERSVVVVMKQRRVRRRCFARQGVVGRAVHQVDVEPAVVVVVDQAHSRPLGLENEALFRRAGGVMPTGQARGFGHILEDDRARLDEASRGDGAMLAVELGLVRPGIGHSAALRLRCCALLAGSRRASLRFRALRVDRSVQA